jgi:hypothetical protein
MVFCAPEEIFLLEAKPEIVVIVFDGCPAIRFVGASIGVEYFGHD